VLNLFKGRFNTQCRTIRSMRTHGLDNIRDGQNAGLYQNVIAFQVPWITGAIHSLVMLKKVVKKELLGTFFGLVSWHHHHRLCVHDAGRCVHLGRSLTLHRELAYAAAGVALRLLRSPHC